MMVNMPTGLGRPARDDWLMLLSSVDTSESGRRAFDGLYANFGTRMDVSPGDWVLSVIGESDPVVQVRLYEVSASGRLAERGSWAASAQPNWVLEVRDSIAALVNPSYEALMRAYESPEGRAAMEQVRKRLNP
ncbi:hypothetical protein [Streptomyces xanthochromogenes]|uniref:hypothetical protein n=1 Tax=Streptomyces xanthochromogenes TaxID=67384 RepID=UPI00341C662C